MSLTARSRAVVLVYVRVARGENKEARNTTATAAADTPLKAGPCVNGFHSRRRRRRRTASEHNRRIYGQLCDRTEYFHEGKEGG